MIKRRKYWLLLSGARGHILNQQEEGRRGVNRAYFIRRSFEIEILRGGDRKLL
jgi:hypothetical protein